MQDNEEQKPIKRKRIKSTYSLRYFSSYAYNRTKKKYPQYTQTDISRALVLYFELAQEDLAVGMKVNFSNKLGNLYLTKEKRTVNYNPDTGVILNNLPINISETSKLWRAKPELKNKTYIRFTNDHSNNYYFRLHFEERRAVFKNKKVYSFKFNRTLKKKLVQNIFDKKVDAYLIPRKNEL